MKITFLLILGLFFFIFINFSFAACQLPDISEYNNCLAGCNGISDLIQKSNCGNTCIGNWSKGQEEYNKCLADELEQAKQKKLEEQKLLEQQQAAEKQKQREEQAREQEQNAPSPEVNSTVTLTRGQVEFWRDGKVSPITSGLEVSAGDVIRTGGDGTVELVSEDGTVQLGEDTVVGFIGLEFNPPSITYQPGLDPSTGLDYSNFRYEPDDMAFWMRTFADIVDFVHENPPEYLFSCAKGDPSCGKDIVTFVYGGITWFDKKIKEDFPTAGMVVTPRAAITPNGTEFIVEVARDGATTVTTLDGSVIVTDLISRKSVLVNMNYRITVPNSSTGLGEQELQQGLTTIEPKSIDRWWIEDINVPKSNKSLIFFVILLIIVAAVGIIAFLIKKRTKPKTEL